MVRSRNSLWYIVAGTLLAVTSACSAGIDDAIENSGSLLEEAELAEESTTTESPLAMVDEETDDEVVDDPAADDPAEMTDTTLAAPADPVDSAPAPTNPAPADPAPADPAPADPAPAGGELDQAEAESFRLLNELRASLGLAALTQNAEMDAFARNWSQTMSTSGNFEHSTGPYGENIAWTSDTSLTAEQAAAQFHDQWVNSSGHYANMTNPGYTLAGIGLFKDANGWHGTHVFK